MKRLVEAAMLLSASKVGAAGEGGIAGDADDVLVAARAGRGPTASPSAARQRGAGVARAVAIVLAFGAQEKAVEPLVGPHRLDAGPSGR